jgi:hypothetical protein
MFGRFRTWFDLFAGAALVAVLLVVIAVDKWPVGAGDLPVNIIAGSTTSARTGAKLRLAITPSQKAEVRPSGFDDMGKLLDQLGAGYRYDVVQPADIIKTPRILDSYDVLFLTCAAGGHELRGALADFVARGGTLYASDWRYDAIAAAFPDVVDRDAVASGAVQELVAEVIDPRLREVIGPTIPLRFDLSRWRTAAFAGPRVTPLLRGVYKKERFRDDPEGVDDKGTFLVKFTHGKGTVIFTSFHNEKQNSKVEIKLLQHLVFQLVNATVDAEVSEANERAGFEPTKSNLLSAPKDNPQVTKIYQHSALGPLRFSLAFRDAGARLRVDLHSPDGKAFHWEGESTLILEVPSAAAGEWRYTITALKLPYDNFPFSATFGAKK